MTRDHRNTRPPPAVRTCRQCGCTDVRACRVAGVPCCWVQDDLCSACAAEPFLRSAPALYWLSLVVAAAAKELDSGRPFKIERPGRTRRDAQTPATP